MPEVQKQDRRNMVNKLCGSGQSPWYDNIERRLFKTGEFARLISEYGIVGVTSNPTIFEKAISNSSDYDEQIRQLVKEGKDSYRIYDELTMRDVSEAADMLLDVYKKTNGLDGYVSIEVLPEYAYDTQKTIADAVRIFNHIGRKNIMIKVPGTKEGCAAVRGLIRSGINVNATLLFSVGQYESIANAYCDGLKDRLKEGKALKNIFSVASVFVSRIDTSIDKMLGEAAGKEGGRAAVANSKIIYQRFKDIFYGAEFAKLKDKGANTQRLLWASTSTKNPNYRDVKYVEELIGPDSINTMPHQTLMAFHEHGVVKSVIENNVDESKRILSGLKKRGIDINSVCEELQRSGVRAFSDSFTSLIASIDKKAKTLK